ncbi:hypothetical protein H2248_000992 [Termitomyces sp. 'cryptogamus']|nr:hypothetical protein H2248_000992 [Termitomyces sp. 'cryptogamus']
MEEKTPKVTITPHQVDRQGMVSSGVDERRLLRKIDLRVIPWLTLLYLLNFMDRGNIGNAKLYNLTDDIHINKDQYLIALTVFFFPYALFEPVSNVFLRKLRPSVWLSIVIFLWGIAMTLHGIIHNYGGLVTVRVLLGLFEAGMYPGIVYYISSWYKRSEMGIRIAVFFSSATVAGAFSGLLATAISNMDGIGNRPGWAWIFIIEGLVTIIVAPISYWIIQDFPDTAKFLTEEERDFVIRRLQEDMQFSAGGEKFRMSYVYQSLTDWKTWVAMGIYMGFDGPLYAFSLFTPTIISQVSLSVYHSQHSSHLLPTLQLGRSICGSVCLGAEHSLGFSSNQANLLSVPVYVWGCILTCIIGFLGDRLGCRYHINLGLFGIGLVAYIILIVSSNAALSYFAVYLAVSAIYPIIPNSVAWVASNIEGTYKRSVTLGIAIGFGNIHGAVTANIYRSRSQYRLGHGIILAYIAIGFVCSLIFGIFLQRENACRDRGERDEIIEGIDNEHANVKNGSYESVQAARIDKGDQWSGFRYTL